MPQPWLTLAVCMQKSLSIAKHEQHGAKDAAVEAHQKLSSAGRELEETRTKAHADGKAAAAKIRALEVKHQASTAQYPGSASPAEILVF